MKSVQQAMSDLMVGRHARDLEAFSDLMDAMTSHYQDAMLDCKQEELPKLQTLCRQCRAISRAIADPAQHRPTL